MARHRGTSGMSSRVGSLETGAEVGGRRKRVSGMLAHGSCGLILTTDDSELWVVDTDDDVARLIGHRVMVEGTAAGLDRLRADWIGAAPHAA